MQKYATFDHTADMGIEIFGWTKKDLFANAAWAVRDILFDLPEQKLLGEQQKKIIIEGADAADLLVNYLREILYLFNGQGFIVLNSEVTQCSNKRLTAILRLEPYDPAKHFIKTELKAVTYHAASIDKNKRGWRARVIFDV